MQKSSQIQYRTPMTLDTLLMSTPLSSALNWRICGNSCLCQDFQDEQRRNWIFLLCPTANRISTRRAFLNRSVKHFAILWAEDFPPRTHTLVTDKSASPSEIGLAHIQTFKNIIILDRLNTLISIYMVYYPISNRV